MERIIVWLVVLWPADFVAGQLVTSGTGQSQINDSFSESFQFGVFFRGTNWFAGVNQPVAPAFGPPLAGAGLNGGYAFNGNGVSGSIGFQFAQGSNRSLSGTSQSVTTSDGSPAQFFSGQLRPFVTGITPVVGGYPQLAPQASDPIQSGRQATLSAIATSQLNLQSKKVQSYLLRAERAAAEGDLKKARANYRLAAGNATEPLRSQIMAHLQSGLTLPSAGAPR